MNAANDNIGINSNGALMSQVAQTDRSCWKYIETSGSLKAKTNEQTMISRYTDTLMCHSLRFPSNIDVTQMTMVIINGQIDLSRVPIKLLSESGFVRVGKKYTIVTTPYKLFFAKLPQLYPTVASYGSITYFRIDSPVDCEYEILLTLRQYDTDPRRRLVQVSQYFIGHQIFESVRDVHVTDIIIYAQKITNHSTHSTG